MGVMVSRALVAPAVSSAPFPCRQAGATVGASAGARLARLEVLNARQAQALATAERRLSQLGTRARLLGRDLQPALRQVHI